MKDNAGNTYMLNNSLEKSDTLSLVNIPEKNVVYEVVRVIRKVPLFWEDHYARLKGSIKLAGIEMDNSQQELKKQIQRLVSENGLSNCNVMLVIFMENSKCNILMYIRESYYPTKAEIEKGTRVSLMKLERKRPNAKIISSEYKEKVARKIKEDNVFEVLLVNKDNKITEGSKSNVFFVKGKKVYTAPGEYILKGITRQYIIDACEKLGFELLITLIGTESIKDMDGLFISGTSIKVFPVSQVDDMHFESGTNPTIIAIRDLFDHLIDEYIKKNM